MQADLTGGLDPALEAFQIVQPADPMMRDSASIWIMDAGGAIAFPRITLDAIGDDWNRPWVQLNLVLADGRAFRLWEKFPADRPEGAPVALGAGPLRFTCNEPFRRWSITFDGEVLESTTAVQMAGQETGRPVPLVFHIEAHMAAPPWLIGSMSAHAAQLMRTPVEGGILGGARYEQLCRVAGFMRLGEMDTPLMGTGMRVRRQGVRNVSAATGHCQHCALFASGRGLGLIAMAPRTDGAPSFNEGFVMDAQGSKHGVRVREAPWMRALAAGGEPLPLLLESETMGLIRIEGQTLLTTFDHTLFEMAHDSILQQGSARYTWDGEATIGLFERCALRRELERP